MTPVGACPAPCIQLAVRIYLVIAAGDEFAAVPTAVRCVIGRFRFGIRRQAQIRRPDRFAATRAAIAALVSAFAFVTISILQAIANRAFCYINDRLLRARISSEANTRLFTQI